MNRKHAFILIVLALVSYFPTLFVGFIWDDHVIVEANPTLSRWSWENIKHDFTSDNALGTGDNYFRPLQAVSDRIDYSVWGLRPFGFHLTNLLFHIGNVLLLYLLLCRLGYGPLVAILSCALFAVHPIDVDEFIEVAGRCTQMGFFFSLATILFSLELGPLAMGLTLVSYVLALLTKESSVIIPALVVLVFYLRREKKHRYGVLIPLLGLTLAYLLAHHFVVHQTIGTMNPGLLQLFMLKVFPRIFFHYATLIACPWNLYSHRQIPHLTHFWPLYGAAFIALSLGIARSKNRTAQFCFGWFLLWLLPTIPPMITGGFMLDHWGYPLAISLFLPLSLWMVQVWESRNLVYQRALGAFYFVYLITLALLVHLNVALRGTDEKMFRWALYFTNSNPIKYNLGVVLLQTGRPMEALPYLLEFQQAYPKDPNIQYALAQAYWQLGHERASNKQSDPLVRDHPEYTDRVKTLRTTRHP